MAVKISKRCSEVHVALERTLGVYDFLKVKMYRKAALFCRTLALLNIERLNF